MYSKNVRSRDAGRRFGETLPPGYDGSRFSRRRRGGEDEIVVIPDSEFVMHDDRSDTAGSAELSRNGIVSTSVPMRSRKHTAPPEIPEKPEIPEPPAMPEEECAPELPPVPCDKCESAEKPHSGGLGALLEKIGIGDEISNEDVLLFALIFMLVSDSESGEGADIVPVLALLLAIR